MHIDTSNHHLLHTHKTSYLLHFNHYDSMQENHIEATILTNRYITLLNSQLNIGRTVPLLKPPQSPHCYLGEVDHAKKFPPPLAIRQVRSYRANWATQTLLFSKPLDLAQVCHRNKICSKPALTLVLAFPAHCIWN